MSKTFFTTVLILIAYLLLWPVAVDPVNWHAPADKGYVNDFQQNRILQQIETLEIKGAHGPEGLALLENELYASTREGWIIRHNPINGEVKNWVHTNGSPLGLAFDHNHNLLVADAYLGLLQISPAGEITTLSNLVNDTATKQPAINYADDVDIAADGKIYFSDASTKFGAEANGGTYNASLLDTIEHGGHGRLLVYNPADQSTKILMQGLNFANGVAMAEDSSFVLVVETGSYRVHKYWLEGNRAGQSEIILDNLPGFPDNIVQGENGRFWIGLVAPRNALIDVLSNYGFLRAVIQRFPAFMRPAAQHYSHVIAIDAQGQILHSLQDPEGSYHTNTGALEVGDWLYISSLHADDLGRISKAKADIQ